MTNPTYAVIQSVIKIHIGIFRLQRRTQFFASDKLTRPLNENEEQQSRLSGQSNLLAVPKEFRCFIIQFKGAE